ncbi:MAG: PEP/pyruvate-binding domain-containing protein [bacterium]
MSQEEVCSGSQNFYSVAYYPAIWLNQSPEVTAWQYYLPNSNQSYPHNLNQYIVDTLYAASSGRYQYWNPFVYSSGSTSCLDDILRAVFGEVVNTDLWAAWYKPGAFQPGWPGIVPAAGYLSWPGYFSWPWTEPEPEYPQAKQIDPADGVTLINELAMFETLACVGDVPGALSVREVKFLITGVDTENPVVYFYNTKKHVYHFFFAQDVLQMYTDLNKFNSETYFTDHNRKNLAGSLIAYSNYQPETGGKGIYALEFWPTDPVKFKFVKIAYDLITAKMPFARSNIAYHAVGEIQRNLFEQEKAEYENSSVKTISSEELFGNTAYSPLNPGEAYGLLRVIKSNEAVTAKDIVIFRTAPNDLTHVAGIITETPQTPLSHINLKANQNNTPNVYIKNASTHPDIAPFIGQYVHFQVTPDGFTIEPASQDDVDAFFESIRPSEPQFPIRDLSVTAIAALSDIGESDFTAYGVKAANVAELAKFLPREMVPDGFAVPFYFYDEFMKYNNFYQRAREMMADEAFRTDAQAREAALAAFRKKIKKGSVPWWMDQELQAVYNNLRSRDSTRDVRARSSTNNEDLEGFNGAGLYESYTHTPDEGRFINTIRQVWASLWTYRAFEEREFYRIDHFQAAMGVLIHHNYSNELANGVAVTKNIFDPNWEGFYVNVQVGEDLVTNPEEESIPDEFLVARIPASNWEIKYEILSIRRSNKTKNGENVMSDQHIQQLIRAMADIHSYFRGVYQIPDEDMDFAMDIEFKVTRDNELQIKQARPWID